MPPVNSSNRQSYYLKCRKTRVLRMVYKRALTIIYLHAAYINDIIKAWIHLMYSELLENNINEVQLVM